MCCDKGGPNSPWERTVHYSGTIQALRNSNSSAYSRQDRGTEVRVEICIEQPHFSPPASALMELHALLSRKYEM